MEQKDKLNELQGKLSEIFEGIDDYYSQSILDELIHRIDNTIDQFNKDFKDLVGKLNKKPVRRTTRKTSTTRKSSTSRKTSTASKAKSTRSKAKTLK
jgi:hypothetical protein